ncbi:MAG: exopolyphosphatase [Rhodomicrobium sp.]|nr:MAG: exopolyphosphatase [Rhodomicrobium sp.]
MAKLINKQVKRRVTGGRLTDLKPVAIIDIGSNSVRLVVFEGAKLTPIPLFNEKCLCGLGREVASSGRLSDDAVERALMALRRFRSVVDQIGATQLFVIATAAAREAENGPEFIQEATKICGKPIEVISGVREAELAAAGVLAGDAMADGLAGDMGGGSLELIDISNRSLSHGSTLPLGGLRLLDQSGGDLKKAKELIDEALASVEWLGAGKGRPFYLVGGTWRAFIKLHMASVKYPLRVLHGYQLDPEVVSDFASEIMKVDDMKSFTGIEQISKQRRGVVPIGALTLQRLIKHIEPSTIITSNYGVREGILYSMLPKSELERDPLLAACDDLSHLRSRSPAHAYELCDWTDRIFELPELEETPNERRLRHAACLIADVGWRTHPSFRAERTMASIAYSVYSGIDHMGRSFLALTSFFRHNGPSADASDEPLTSLMSKRMLERARLVGCAIRAAHMVSAGVMGIIPKTKASYEDGQLVLDLPHPFDALDGERLERRFKSLGKLLGLDTVIRVNRDSRFFGFLDL